MITANFNLTSCEPFDAHEQLFSAPVLTASHTVLSQGG